MESEIIEADITCNETREYPYLFNKVAFSYVTMDWFVVSRVRMTKQAASTYCLAYSKTFNRCKYSNSNFKLGTSYLVVLFGQMQISKVLEVLLERSWQSLF